jgi:hypothetical protein
VFLLTDDQAKVLSIRTPRQKALKLLESLLDGRQLNDWKLRQSFDVDTRYGAVTLGKLYDLVLTKPGGGKLHLCVVPGRHGDLPIEDVWAGLLLALRTDAEPVFQVANYRLPHERQFRLGPVPRELLAARDPDRDQVSPDKWPR